MSVPYGASVLTVTKAAATGSRRRPVPTAVLGAACISFSAILVTLSRADPVSTAFFRCALALPVLVPLALLERHRLGPRPLRGRVSAGVAGLFLAVDLVLWNHAIADVGAGVATVLGNLQVVFVAAFGWLILRERPGRRYLLMLPVVLAGVVLVSGVAAGGPPTGLHPAAGIWFGLATSAAYACFLLIMRGTARDRPHIAGNLADATAGAAVGSLLIGFMLGGLQFELSWSSVRWLLLLALVSQTAGWLLITSSLPRLPAAVSSLLLLLQPAAALVLADVILAERPTPVQVAGAALVCVGVLVSTMNPAGTEPVTGAGTARSGEPDNDGRNAGAVTANRT